NTTLVSTNDGPKAVKDLLDPKWKGKMSIAGTSTGVRWIGSTIEVMGREFLDKLAEQEIKVQDMSGAALAGLVGAGEVPLSPTIFDADVTVAKQKGAPIEWRPLEPVVTTVGYSALSSKAPHPHAALLFLYNGKIRTFASETSTCEAIACAGSRIVATGTSDDIRRFAGPETQAVDLRGRTAIPGLTDTHVHLSEKGTAEMKLVDCRDFYVGVVSVADILQRLANAAASAPKGSWIVAHGSPMQDFRLKDKRFPDKHDLDRAVPDNPVSISFGAHITVGNSLALAAAKITADTPDPAGGHIKHDPQTGKPTGELHERAQLILKKVAPEFNYLQLKDGIVYALNQCLERGVTTVHDIVRYAEPVRAYQELYKENRMHARVSILPRVIESMIESKSLIELGLITGFGNEWLRVGGVKMSIDGGITGRNACFYEPYEDDGHNHGIIPIH